MKRVSYADLRRMSEAELRAWSEEAIRESQRAGRLAAEGRGGRALDVGESLRRYHEGRSDFAAAAEREWSGGRIRESLVGRKRRSLPWRLAETRRHWKRAQLAAEVRAFEGEALFDFTYGHAPRLRTYLGDVGRAVRLQVPPAALRELPGPVPWYRDAAGVVHRFPGLAERAAPLVRRLGPAAHVVGRIAAPVGLAFDIYEIGRTSGMAVSWRRAEEEAYESGVQVARLMQRRAEQLEAQQERRLAAAIAERMPYVEEWIREHASPDPELLALSRAPWEGRPSAGDLAGAVFHPERSWAAGPAPARGVGGYAPGMLDFRRESPEELRERGAVEEALAIAPWAESREDVLKEIARGLQELGLLDRPQDAHR